MDGNLFLNLNKVIFSFLEVEIQNHQDSRIFDAGYLQLY